MTKQEESLKTNLLKSISAISTFKNVKNETIDLLLYTSLTTLSAKIVKEQKVSEYEALLIARTSILEGLDELIYEKRLAEANN